ncbi:hypothetical protein D9M73_292630 [compost metagenome]
MVGKDLARVGGGDGGGEEVSQQALRVDGHDRLRGAGFLLWDGLPANGVAGRVWPISVPNRRMQRLGTGIDLPGLWRRVAAGQEGRKGS